MPFYERQVLCVRVENLCKSFGSELVLDRVTFTAEAGVTALMAPSGTGKTTLLRILLGLERPDRGVIRDAPRRWSSVFQEDRLLGHLSAMENLRFALGRDLDEDAARALLDRLGLGAEGDKAVEDYSGGMKRRLSLARALLAKSDAIALDEPFTGLDEENRRICIEAIRAAAPDRLILLVTHDIADAEALCATVIQI